MSNNSLKPQFPRLQCGGDYASIWEIFGWSHSANQGSGDICSPQYPCSPLWDIVKVVPPWVSHIEIEQEIQPVVTEGRDGPESQDAENEELEEAWGAGIWLLSWGLLVQPPQTLVPRLLSFLHAPQLVMGLQPSEPIVKPKMHLVHLIY